MNPLRANREAFGEVVFGGVELCQFGSDRVFDRAHLSPLRNLNH
jgi:hypothetical protein